jgi:hypothetical protein
VQQVIRIACLAPLLVVDGSLFAQDVSTEPDSSRHAVRSSP